MPTYQYECDACEHGFEELQDINADKLTDCPECSKPKLIRLIGAAVLIFKGAWGDKRRKKVEAQLKKQEKRVERGLKTGKMTQAEVDRMAAIRDKYANKSTFLIEPDELKGKQKKRHPNQVNYESSKPLKEPDNYGGDSRKVRDNPNEV